MWHGFLCRSLPLEVVSLGFSHRFVTNCKLHLRKLRWLNWKIIIFNRRYVQLIHVFVLQCVMLGNLVWWWNYNWTKIWWFLNFLIPVSKPAFFLQASLKNFSQGERLGGRQGWCFFLLDERFRTPDSSKSQASWGGAELNSPKKTVWGLFIASALGFWEGRNEHSLHIRWGPSPDINGVKYPLVV